LGCSLEGAGGKHAVAFRGGPVAFLDIFLHHAVGVENGADAADRLLHDAYPAARQAVAAAVVEEGHNLLFQEVVNGPALNIILIIQIGVLLAGADGPAVVLGITFHPPTVEHAHVNAAVAADLHAACSRGLERPARIVQPNINALHQGAGHMNIVVFQPDNAATAFSPSGSV